VLSVNAELRLNYSGTATGFNWEITRLSAAPSASPAGVIGGRAGSTTTSPRFNLGALNLQPGSYLLKVQVVNGTQTSNWASAQITLVSADLSSLRIYPNPWRQDRGHHALSFDQMPANSTVKIFTVSGRWIKTLEAPAGTAAWDLKGSGGDAVASGIYLYTIQSPDNQKTSGHFTVIR
jgi:hypothetical protein